MIRFIYNLLWPIGLLAILPQYLVKMVRRGNYAPKFGQRFGIYSREVRARLASSRPVWLHAVSVGEVNVALKIAAAIRALNPGINFALTTTTTTGFAVANKRAPEWIEVLYSPLDFYPVIRAALRAFRPRQLVLVEQEIWPNMVAETCAKGLSVSLVNARLSPRSERRFLRFRRYVRPLLRQLDLVCVQYPEDVARWEKLGVDPATIQMTGSIKYDHAATESNCDQQRELLRELGVARDAPVLVAGSTHRGEEDTLARVWQDLRQEFPNLFLVVAPRHTERAGAIYQMFHNRGVNASLRSTSKAQPPTDALIVDTTGELQQWYELATIVFIGKSLATRGGQNPVEAINAGAPVIFGPHMENFAALSRALVEANGAVQINTESELLATIRDLLQNPERRDGIVRSGREVLHVHQGAAARTAQLLQNLPAHPIA